MMRICYLIGSFQCGGAEDQLLRIIQKLDRRKFQPVIAVFSKDGPLYENFKKLNVPIKEFKYKRFRYLFIKQLIPFIKFLKKEKIKIIHMQLVGTLIFGLIGAFFAGVKYRIITLQNVCRKDFSPLDKFALYLVSILGHKVIAVSEKVKTTAVKNYNINPKKITVVHNSIVSGRMVSSGNINKENKAFKNNVIITTVGTLFKQKGHEYIIKAASLCKNNKIRFIIVGDGPLKKHLQNIINISRLNDKFIFLGYRKDIPEILNSTDIFLMSSLWEGFSVALLEAMDAEKAIIATDVGGNAEAIEHGKNGFIIPPANPEAIAKYVDILSRDANLRKRFGKQAKITVLDNFTAEIMAKKLENIYYRLLDKH